MSISIVGVDFSGDRPNVNAMKKAGVRFVIRYASTGRKGITAEETRFWSNNGIAICAVYESTANRALTGRPGGVADAMTARTNVRNAGGPTDGGVIYFAVDFDTTNDTQRAAVLEYFTGCAQVLTPQRVGVYGEYEVIDFLLRHHAGVQWFWQTYAWSGGAVHPAAHLYQHHNGVSTFNGVALGAEVDLNLAFQLDYGQWFHKETDMPLIPADSPIIEQAIRNVLHLPSDGLGIPTGMTNNGQLARELLSLAQGAHNTLASLSDDEAHIVAAVRASEVNIESAIANVQSTGVSDPAAFARAVLVELRNELGKAQQ